MFSEIDNKAVSTLRLLSVDMIQEANSGHPGLPLGAAPMAYVLWSKFLKINPLTSKNWFDRDRFILSAGHGSALLYSLLHLSGYNLTIDDLKNFRKINSKTPGHPEVDQTDGVEASTGPLGQGIAMAVGMAMSEAHLASKFNKNKFDLINHYTYVLCGDGDLMEGISYEAMSVAGHLKLNKLIILYDSNDISLDGETSKSFTENIEYRCKALKWNYIKVNDGNSLNEIYKAIEAAKTSTEPTLIEVKTIIGFGSTNQGTSKVHGSPLGEDELKRLKISMGYNPNEKFYVSQEVRAHFINQIIARGDVLEKNWEKLLENYSEVYPEKYSELRKAIKGELQVDWEKSDLQYNLGLNESTRVTSKNIIQELSIRIPYLWGGSADLSSSNYTRLETKEDFDCLNYSGDNIWFGVREFSMAAIMNGIQLHGGTRVFGGTFFVFSDYLKAAVRLSALQHLPVIYVLTHDSVAVGEDGPTHEPIEQLAGFRAMPDIQLLRPADANETKAAWKLAIETTNRPTLLILSRQNLPLLNENYSFIETGVNHGGYIISKSKNDIPEGILIATGSEVSLSIQAQEELFKMGHDVSVVSIPCWDRFDNQSDEYKEKVLPKKVWRRVSIEMGATLGWEKYVGLSGAVIGINCFGLSGEEKSVKEYFGFTVEDIVEKYLSLRES